MTATYSPITERELLQTLLTLKSVLRNSGVSIKTYNNYAALMSLTQSYEKKKIVLTFEKLGDLASKILGYLNEKIVVPSGPEDDILVDEWERLWAEEAIKKAVSLGCC